VQEGNVAVAFIYVKKKPGDMKAGTHAKYLGVEFDQTFS